MNRKQYLINCIVKGIKPDIEPENNEELQLCQLAEKMASQKLSDFENDLLPSYLDEGKYGINILNMNQAYMASNGDLVVDAVYHCTMDELAYVTPIFVIVGKGSSDITMEYPAIGWWGAIDRGNVPAKIIDGAGKMYSGTFKASYGTWASEPRLVTV